MKVNIITDGASDLTDEETKALSIIKIPMPVSFKGDGAEKGGDFWQALKAGKVAVTSQVTPDKFFTAFARIKEAGESAMCVTISSEMSATYKNALLAKADGNFDNVEIADSRMASLAEGFLVREAAALIKSGLSARETAEELGKLKKKIKLLACMDSLKYVARGGRISASAAAIGAIMNIKPIITFSGDGKVKVAARPHGKKKGAAKICELIKEWNADLSRPVSLIYSDDPGSCGELCSKLKEAGVSIGEKIGIGPTIGAHIGPGAFGAVFMTRE